MSSPWLSPAQQHVWRTYLRVWKLLFAQLNGQIATDAGLSGPEFEVLVNLSEAPDGRLRPYQLAESMQWEQSRVSHQLTRMGKRGFLRREDCPSDARGSVIVLTEQGRDAIVAAAPAHAEFVKSLFFEPLDPADLAALGRALDLIVARVESVSGDAPYPPECLDLGERVTVDE
jgi:DNA-binding MarR family transcriptional regulator